MTRFHGLLTAGVLIAATTGGAHATLLGYEGFDSYSPTAAIAGQSGGTNWTGAWTGSSAPIVQAGGLNYSAGSITINGGANNALADDTNADTLLSRPFTAAGDVWFSLLFQPSSTSGDYFYFYLSDDADYLSSGDMGVTGATVYSARAQATPSSDRDQGDSSVSVTNGTVVFLVGHIYNDPTYDDDDIGSGDPADPASLDTIDLWINPTSLTLGTPSASSLRIFEISTVSTFGIRAVNLDAGDAPQFDELRIGTTLADVIPVPEPASLALIGLGAIALIRRKH